MSGQWYYVKAGERCGPIPEEELKAIVDRGEIPPAALVWQSGMGDWKPYAELFTDNAGSSIDEPESSPSEPTSQPRRERNCANCGKETQELKNRNGRMLCPDCSRAFAITEPEGKNGKAIAGLCLGILSLICCGGCGVFSVLGFVFSIMGLSDYNRNPEIGGKGLAVAGIVLSVVSLLKDIIVFLVGIFGQALESGGL